MDIKIHAGVQSNADTAQTQTIQTLIARNCSIEPKYSNTTSQALGIGGSFISDGWVSRAEVDGDIETELSISQFVLFMEALGFKRKVKDTKNLEFNVDPDGFTKYLTIIKDLYSEGVNDVARGCLVSSLKLNTTLQAYVTATASMIGLEYTSNKAKFSGTPTVVNEGTLICLGTTIKENNTDITAKVESIDITIDRKLEAKGGLNTIYTKAIKPNGKGEVSLNLQFNEFDKDSYHTAQEMLKNNTTYTVEVELKDTLDKTRIIKLKFPKVKIANVNITDLEGTGGLSKELKAYTPTGKDMPFEVLIENYTK